MASTGQRIASGASTGAGIGTAIAPGIGTAIGAGLGAIAGGLSSLGGAKQKYRKYVKDQFKNLMEKGTTLSDEERRQMGRATVEAQAQAQAAQDIAAQRQAMAQTGGSPILAGQQRRSAKEMGEATRDIAVKADSQARKMAMALDERRRAELMQRMANIADQANIEAGQNVQAGLAAADAAAEIAKLV